VEQNVMEGINHLRNFQVLSGGFSYWPGQDRADQWGSSYAGHLLITAEQKGYKIPTQMKTKWIYYQKSIAQSWTRNQYFGSMLNQAYRLYTLALAGEPEIGAMNRLSQNNYLNERTIMMLALAYAQAGHDKMARKLMNATPTTHISRYDYYYDYTYGSSTRDLAIQLMLLTKLGERDKAFELVKRISKILDSNRWLSTQTMAYSLMAVSQYYNGKTPESLKFSYSWNGKKQSFDSHEYVFSNTLSNPDRANGKLHFTNNSNGALYVRLIKKGIPVEGKEISRSDNLTMTVTYVDMEGKVINPTRLEQGTDFKAIVEIRNPGQFGYYPNMALTQVFPSGWEIINTRLLGQETESSTADYVDIRDDRVYTYFGISKRNSKKYVILLNASYEGKFYLPAMSCSAMYENSIGATIKGQWVEIYK
jgi:uncharacterized protein YfaS (alpha-2-macroglobulin family)